MAQLFGIPTLQLSWFVAGLLALVLAGMGWLAWRRPLLVRLGIRAAPRRKLRTLLIVLGLTTSTAVITTAIGTGETMAGTIRAVVAGGVGPVDAVIIAGSNGQPAPSIRDPRALLTGADLAAGAIFPERVYADLSARVGGDPAVAAFEPALQYQATALSPGEGKARTGVNLIGLRPNGSVFARLPLSEGGEFALNGLPEGGIALNQEAARLLAVVIGDELQLTLPGDRQLSGTVAVLVRDGGLAGIQPAVYLPVARVQEAAGHPDSFNQILVTLKSGGDEAQRSRDFTGRLRLALAEPNLMARIARALATDNGQGQLRALEARVRPELKPVIADLRRVARSGQPSPDLAYYLADPLLTTEYRWVLNTVAGEGGGRNSEIARRVAPMTVLEVKQRAIQAANEYGSAVTTVFLILGLFSIAASLLLVFLIFVMLAAERRTEMGLARAVGAQRRHLVAALLVEGLVYDLAAAALGLTFGVAVGAMVVRLVQRVLTRFDVVIHGQISAGGLLLSFSLGALVTFATVLLAAWRVSNVNIIAAVHGAPDPERSARRLTWRRRLATVLLYLLPVAAGAALLTLARTPGVRAAVGGSLLLLTAALIVRAIAVALGARAALVDRLVATLVGPAIALLFALSPSAPAALRNETAIRTATAGFVVAGVAMALALVWAAGRNLDVLLSPVRWLARPFGSLAPATRMAVSYPLTHPFRTGLTAAMFALVFLTMVAATTLLRSTELAYVRRDGGAGFDIRAQFSTPPAAFADALAQSNAVRPEDFSLIGSQAATTIEAIWPGDRLIQWRPMDIRVADAALLSGSSGQLLARATGYRSDDDVWRALREQPGTALAARGEVSGIPGMQAAVAVRDGGTPRFEPVTAWLRDPSGGPSKRLTVIGVVADGSILPSGLLTAAAALGGTPVVARPPSEFFLRARPETSLRTAATGIELTFPDSTIRTRILGEEARTGQAVRTLLDSLIRGFLGMGLASGIAALGVVGMRSVAERRQQIGMLRALGFSRRSVQATFLIEGSVVAILGITIGGVVGLVLARNVVFFLAHDFQLLQLAIPWRQVAALALAAYSAALLSALAVAWQAGRVTPAEALRYE